MLNKLSKIDRITVGDHWYLSLDDEVWYFGEYSAGKGYDGPGNQLITNLKHGAEHRCDPPSGRWYYKIRDIGRVGEALANRVSAAAVERFTFVPIPPSVVRSDPTYDSRNLDILNVFKQHVRGNADVRELIYQRCSTRKSHHSDERVTQAELIDTYRIDESCANPPPQEVVLFDDVLTTGAHFKAARHVILQRFPGIPVRGIVVCRRKIPNPFEGDGG